MFLFRRVALMFLSHSGNATASKSDGSGKRMKEVACPTCTVHLQV